MRIFSVLVRDLEEDRKGLTTYSITVVAIITALALIQAIAFRFTAQPDESMYEGLYFGFLFLGGMIFTSLSFSDDLYNRIRNHQFLMLPASPLEKLLSRALISAIIYPVALTLLFTLASLALEPLLYLLFREPMNLFNPFQKNHLTGYFNYISVTSVFFLGSIYFRKVHFFKTILASLVILFTLSMISTLLIRLFFFDYFSGWELSHEFQYSFVARGSWPLGTYRAIGNIIYFILLPLFSYTVAYFRIQEVQATDALQ